MERKVLTVRISSDLHEALSVLGSIEQRSMNDLVTSALSEFVVSEARSVSQGLENTLEQLRAYTRQDPDFEQAITQLAKTEASLDDPLEGEVVEVKPGASLRDQLHSLSKSD